MKKCLSEWVNEPSFVKHFEYLNREPFTIYICVPKIRGELGMLNQFRTEFSGRVENHITIYIVDSYITTSPFTI